LASRDLDSIINCSNRVFEKTRRFFRLANIGVPDTARSLKYLTFTKEFLHHTLAMSLNLYLKRDCQTDMH
jgi:hypothetical protein